MAGLPVTGTIPTVRATVPASANTAAMSPVNADDPGPTQAASAALGVVGRDDPGSRGCSRRSVPGP